LTVDPSELAISNDRISQTDKNQESVPPNVIQNGFVLQSSWSACSCFCLETSSLTMARNSLRIAA
jgi:hypothetical protein